MNRRTAILRVTIALLITNIKFVQAGYTLDDSVLSDLNIYSPAFTVQLPHVLCVNKNKLVLSAFLLLCGDIHLIQVQQESDIHV